MTVITVLKRKYPNGLEGNDLIDVKNIIFTETQPHAQVKL
jgi:hypothetical protein